jgi:predicted pyridoxine 5'-phosphate oxidase superfamily flavin-nucleotide-binding protein
MNFTQDMKDALSDNIGYFATSSKDGKPNVVPMGLISAISDSQLMIVDVRMNKTRKNLAENCMVALAVTDTKRSQAYQFKGKAAVITSGELFDNSIKTVKESEEKRRQHIKLRFEETNDPKLRIKLAKRMNRTLHPKAVIVIDVEEVYPTM